MSENNYTWIMRGNEREEERGGEKEGEMGRIKLK